jgi:SHS2 domain-containing protein
MDRYREIEHTADVGIEISGTTRAELFENAAFGVTDLLIDARTVRPLRPDTFTVRAGNAEELLVRWLSEFLYRFDARRELFSSFRIRELSETHLTAEVAGETYDPSHHRIRREIKAVTYHGLQIRGRDGAWKARVIFDI